MRHGRTLIAELGVDKLENMGCAIPPIAKKTRP